MFLFIGSKCVYRNEIITETGEGGKVFDFTVHMREMRSYAVHMAGKMK